MTQQNDRLELWIQGAIAMVMVISIACIYFVEALGRQPLAVPDLLGFGLAAVLGYFFGGARQRAVQAGVETATNGMMSAATKVGQAIQQAQHQEISSQ